MFTAATDAFVITRLTDDIGRQQRQLCTAEYQLRAKITEIEIQIHTYVYVPPAPVCRR